MNELRIETVPGDGTPGDAWLAGAFWVAPDLGLAPGMLFGLGVFTGPEKVRAMMLQNVGSMLGGGVLNQLLALGRIQFAAYIVKPEHVAIIAALVAAHEVNKNATDVSVMVSRFLEGLDNETSEGSKVDE